MKPFEKMLLELIILYITFKVETSTLSVVSRGSYNKMLLGYADKLAKE